MILLRRDLGDLIKVDQRTDLVHHPFFILLEISKLDLQFKKPGRKTRGVNV